MMWSNKAASVSLRNYGCWINTQKRRGESFPATWNWGQTRRKEHSRCTHFPSVLCSHPLPGEYQAVFSRAYYQSTFKTSQTIDKGSFEAANAAKCSKGLRWNSQEGVSVLTSLQKSGDSAFDYYLILCYLMLIWFSIQIQLTDTDSVLRSVTNKRETKFWQILL